MGCNGGRLPLGTQSCLGIRLWLYTLSTRRLEDRCSQHFGRVVANEDTKLSGTASDRRKEDWKSPSLGARGRRGTESLRKVVRPELWAWRRQGRCLLPQQHRCPHQRSMPVLCSVVFQGHQGQYDAGKVFSSRSLWSGKPRLSPWHDRTRSPGGPGQLKAPITIRSLPSRG